MRRILNAAALSVVVSGGWILSHPRPAAATYMSPFAAFGVSYCCRTTGSASCCFSTGCATKPGMCIRLP
jgi:hypothetical protein